MTTKPRYLTLSVLSLTVALMSAACGGSDATPTPMSMSTAPAPAPAPPADTTPPTVAVASSAAGGTATGAVTFTFTFSEDVGTSFTTEDLVVSGGTKSAFARLSGTQATLVVIPTPSAVGTININIAAGTFADTAGNANTGTTFAAQAYNTTGAASAIGLSVLAHGGAGWDVSAAATVWFTLGTAVDCAGSCAVKVRLVSTQSASCVADADLALMAVPRAAYSKGLAEFTISGCGVNTVAAFKQVKVAEVHVQMLRAGVAFNASHSSPGAPAVHADGLDLGDSIAFEVPMGAPAHAPAAGTV